MRHKRFLTHSKIFLFLLISISLFTGCQAQSQSPQVQVAGEQVKVEGGSYMNVTPTELNSLLQDKDFTLVNVHTPYDGKIAHTDLLIPYDQITQDVSQLPADKNARILLYCRSGHMSDIAAKSLIKLGYTNIWNLAGGMSAWETAGLPITH